MSGIRERLGLDQNVGGRDRQVRASLALIFLGIGGFGLVTGELLLGIASLLAAAVFGFNVLTGFCGLNAALGVNTCKWEADERSSVEAE